MTPRASFPRLASGASIVALLLVVLAPILVEWVATQDEVPEGAQTLDEEHHLGDIVVRLLRILDPDHARVQRLVLLRNGIEIARIEDYLVSLQCLICEVGGPDHLRMASPQPGENMTGETGRQLAIYQSSGGNSCCDEFTILSLGPEIEVLANVAGSYPAFLVQMDDDPALEIVTFDPVYWGWHAMSNADRVAPLVVLKFDPVARKYAFAEEIMRAPPPDADDLAAMAQGWKTDYEWDKTLADGTHGVPNGLREAVLELAYSGNLVAAIELIDAAWPDGMEKARDDFIADLRECRLRASAYWPGIARINGLDAAPPPAHCPKP